MDFGSSDCSTGFKRKVQSSTEAGQRKSIVSKTWQKKPVASLWYHVSSLCRLLFTLAGDHRWSFLTGARTAMLIFLRRVSKGGTWELQDAKAHSVLFLIDQMPEGRANSSTKCICFNNPWCITSCRCKWCKFNPFLHQAIKQEFLSFLPAMV